jgi:predicted TPR repeat methyltransferase
MTQDFLDRAYGLDSLEDTQKLYSDWSASYDQEVGKHGYATPKRVAAALAAHVGNQGAPVLDFGCGTGLSGLALRTAGLSCVDGVDINADMVAGALDKGIYRNVTVGIPGEMPAQPSEYRAIAAIGVIGTGAAPAATLDLLLDALAPGDLLGFSYNDHALAEPEFTDRRDGVLNAGRARMIFHEYGPHLPGVDLNSMVYVFEKT